MLEDVPHTFKVLIHVSYIIANSSITVAVKVLASDRRCKPELYLQELKPVSAIPKLQAKSTSVTHKRTDTNNWSVN
jgi:hypothetical protein